MNVKTVRYGDKNAARDFTRSLLETGFAVLTDHPVPVELIQNTYKEWENFFADNSKNDYLFDAKTQAGYFPFRSENAKDSRREGFERIFSLLSFAHDSAYERSEVYSRVLQALDRPRIRAFEYGFNRKRRNT